MGISITGKDVTIISKKSSREWSDNKKASSIFQQKLDFYRTTADAQPKKTRVIWLKGRWRADESLDTLKVRIFSKLENKRYFSSVKCETNASIYEMARSSKIGSRSSSTSRSTYQRDIEVTACMQIKAYEIYVGNDRKVTAIIEGYGCSSKDMKTYADFRKPFVEFLGRNSGGVSMFLKSIKGAVQILKGSFWAKD